MTTGSSRREFLKLGCRGALSVPFVFRSLGTAFLLFGIFATAAEQPELQMWPLDSLIKVFPDVAPGQPTAAQAEVARGECASLQVVVRADVPIRGLQARVSTLKCSQGQGVLMPRLPRFVGYVPVDRPTQKASRDQLRKPPADFPDPLLECDACDVAAGKAQSIWVTVPVPTSASSGVYRGTLTVSGAVGGKEMRAKCPLEVNVHRAVVGASRLWVTDWFAVHSLHMQNAPEPESEAFYALMRRYARNLADHRHNVALISPLRLAEFSAGPNNTLAINFDRFDRWVQIFREEGVIGRIEGGHIGRRKGGWKSEFVADVYRARDGRVAAETASPASAEADAFYAQFFPSLVAHLKKKGWLSCYLQHLADEPIADNSSSYKALAALARKYAPELRIIEACHTKELAGAMDVWVPQLNYLHRDFAHYQARQRSGEEVWFYTCVFPQGEYANRFIEQPLIKTRLLHWLNYRYGITGYLHWGYNKWTQDSPFTHTTRPHNGPPYLPAGDPWIVYPGKDGPLDSIRFEAMRDGIADYELLCQLGQKDPEAAQRIARRHILDFDRYETDVQQFRTTRRELLNLMDAAQPGESVR